MKEKEKLESAWQQVASGMARLPCWAGREPPQSVRTAAARQGRQRAVRPRQVALPRQVRAGPTKNERGLFSGR